MAAVRSERDLKRDVVEALHSDVRVDPTGIAVDAINGVVYLRGTIPDYYQKRVAGEDASRVRGVVDVVNELRVMPVTPRTDQEITDDVRAVLTRDARVDETKIDVDTLGGVVRLSGTVDSYADKLYASADAWTVPGVIDVANDIVVRPTAVKPDVEVLEAVRGALLRDPRVDASDVVVDVQDGVAYLRGSVPTGEQRWRAEEDAWWTAGVRSVVNELEVGRRPAVRAESPTTEQPR